MKHTAVCLLMALGSACSVGLRAPNDVTITCSSDADCPTDYKCEQSAGTCFDTRVSVPQVFIDPIARSVGDVAIGVTIADSEGALASVAAQYDTGGGFLPATLDGASDLETSREGTHHVVTWHAGADIGSNGYIANVTVRVTATAHGGAGPVAQADSFAFGDDAPTVTSVAVNGTSPLTGNVIIDFGVSDSSSDPIAVAKLEVSYDGRFDDTVVIYDASVTQATSVLPSGAVVGLESSPAGVTHAFTWSSAGTSIVDAPNSVLRLTVADAFMTSAAAVSAPFYLRNQLPPRVSALSSPAAVRHRASGPTPFIYRLIDENGDPANVVFEYSPDGFHFSRCNEYPAPESEGLIGLTTANEASGGVEHVFIWDTSAVETHGGAIAVRARADTPTDAGQTVAMPLNAGEAASPQDTTFKAFDVAGFTDGVPAVLALGDFNGDGFIDVVTNGDGAFGVTDFVNFGCALTGCFSGLEATADTPPAGSIVSLAAADLNEDGIDDTIVVRDSLWIRQTRASSLYLGANISGLTRSGDFDGDGHADLAVQQSNGIAVLFGDGHGALSPPVMTSAASPASFALARINGDAADDLYVAYSGHYALFTSTGDRSRPFSVTDLTISANAVFDTCDLNGDGLTDLVDKNAPAALEHYILDASGAMRGPFTVNINFPLINGFSCADLDNDGDSDLTVGVIDFTQGEIRIALNSGPDSGGTVSFSDGIIADTIGSGETANLYTKARIADGRWVTAAASQNGRVDYFGTLLSGGIGSFTNEVVSAPAAYGASGTQYTEYVVADFDGDGVNDHLFNNGGNDLELWHDTGVRGLATGLIERSAVLPIAAQNLATGDANNDGNADIWYSGQLAYGNGDGTFASAITSAKPAGFRSQPLVQTSGPPSPAADFDGDGIYDCVPDASNVVELQAGGYTTSNPPGLGTPGDPFPATCSPTVTLTGGQAALEGFNLYFASDLNDDGLPDLIESSLRTVTIFSVFYGNNVSHASRLTKVGAFAAAPQVSAPVTALADDIVGSTVAFHPVRAGGGGVVIWEDDLVASGMLASGDTQRPLTIPYELRGDIRLTTDTTTPGAGANPPLHSEPRLGARVGTGLDQSRAGLDAQQRGLIIDLPVMAGNGAPHLAGARVFRRVTDYDKLDTGMPHHRYSWSEVSHDADGDLTTGTGPRFITAVRGSGTVVRVLTDRAGVFVAFAP